MIASFFDPERTRCIHAWHANLRNYEKADRSALARANRPEDAFLVPAFGRLRREILDERWRAHLEANRRLARIAIAVAAIRKVPEPDESGKEQRSLGRWLAMPYPKTLSAARLKVLTTADDPDLFLRLLRGSIKLKDDNAPVIAVAEVMRARHYPTQRRKSKSRLILDWIDAAPDGEIKKLDK
jgi:CRISPR system Cascade subunit CasB